MARTANLWGESRVPVKIVAKLELLFPCSKCGTYFPFFATLKARTHGPGTFEDRPPGGKPLMGKQSLVP